VARVLAAMRSPLEPDVRGEASNEILHQYLSAAKARRLLDWSPLFTLDSALDKTIAWYTEFFESQAQAAQMAHVAQTVHAAR
jgi:CDP-glucose 4,6-dehydratase